MTISPASTPPPAATDEAEARPLSQFARLDMLTLADDDRDAVVSATGQDSVEVCTATGHVRLAGDQLATPLHDPHRVERLRHAVLAWHIDHHHSATTENRQLREQLDAARLGHAQTLAAIRAYAIDKHQRNDICRDGLDTFLDTFGMQPYQPRHRVSFTITGTVDIDATHDELDNTEQDVRNYLAVDADRVDDVDTDTLHYHVTVDSAERLD